MIIAQPVGFGGGRFSPRGTMKNEERRAYYASRGWYLPPRADSFESKAPMSETADPLFTGVETPAGKHARDDYAAPDFYSGYVTAEGGGSSEGSGIEAVYIPGGGGGTGLDSFSFPGGGGGSAPLSPHSPEPEVTEAGRDPFIGSSDSGGAGDEAEDLLDLEPSSLPDELISNVDKEGTDPSAANAVRPHWGWYVGGGALVLLATAGTVVYFSKGR